MGIFRGDGGTGDSNTDATVTAVTEQATIATTKASEAADSATAAGTSATNAASSASASSVSSAASSTYAGEAASSATSAATSATASAASATAAATAETNAETAETNAETAETNAAASAATATTKAGEAATSATNASTSASTATTKASEASTSASNASTSETNAATSASTATTKASEASTSASNAATSATNAAASYDDFDDRYLGAKSSAPTTDNDGDALVTGALYFDTTTNSMKVWSGSAWLDAYASLSGALIATNNLSDLNNATTSRTNLGLGTAATTASTDYATAAQGTTADNALPKSGGAMTGAITTNSTFDGRDVATDGTKLDGIEASADVTDTTNVVAALSAGTGISLSVGGVIANTSPDQAVALTGGTGISTSGTYPNFTITNDSPDQTVSLTGAGTTTVSGTYPNFTITGAGTTYTAGTGITLTGTEFSIGQGVATTDSPAFAGLTVDTTTLAVDSTNNRVGIGTASPASALDVNGTVTCDDLQVDLGTITTSAQITTPSSLSGFQAFSIKNTHTEGYLTFGTTLGEARIQAMGVNGSADPLNIDVGQTTAIGIDATGKVGINTSAPEATLHIADIGSTGPALHIAGGSNTEGDITTPHTENLQIGHWNESTDTFTQRVEIDTSGNMSISKALFLKSPNDAHQRVDGRDSDTTESRAHWYGVDSSGGTQNFRHAWYDGSSYVNVDVNNGGVGFNGYLKAIRLYSNTAGTTGYFFNDSGTRTAYAGGDFYIQSSVGNCYIYATNTYLGNTANDVIHTRGNRVTGNNFEFAAAGDFYVNAGYGSKQLAYGVRAWARYEMTGTHSFRDDEGFSSVTDIGTGRSRLNFTNTMPNTYYSVNMTTGSTSYTNQVCSASVYSLATTLFYVSVEDLDGGFIDRDQMNVMVVR